MLYCMKNEQSPLIKIVYHIRYNKCIECIKNIKEVAGEQRKKLRRFILTQEELEKLTSKAIRKIAGEHKIKYVNNYSKKELIEKILLLEKESTLPKEEPSDDVDSSEENVTGSNEVNDGQESKQESDQTDQDDEEKLPLEMEKVAADMISSEQLKLLDDEKPEEVEATNKSADKQDVENKKEISPAPSKEQVDMASSRQEAMDKLRSNSSSATVKKKKPTSNRKLDYFLLPISLLMLILLVSSFVTLAYEILWTGNKENDILSMSILILVFIILMKYVKASIKNGTARKVLNHYHAKIEKELEEKEDDYD